MSSRAHLFSGALAFAAVLVFAAAAPLQAQIIAGPGDGVSVETEHAMTYDEGWEIGSEDDRVEVTYDPAAGAWVKTLVGRDGGPFQASEIPEVTGIPQWYQIKEHLVIGGRLGWSDWHEEIVTPGWDWGPGLVLPTILADGNPVAVTNMIVTPPQWPIRGGAVSYYFDELPPGTKVDIRKGIYWEGNPAVQGEGFNGTVTIRQYPTPEPGTLVLLAIGGACLLGYGWRRRKRTAGLPV